jgi:AcrR family transcriptional regulator
MSGPPTRRASADQDLIDSLLVALPSEASRRLASAAIEQFAQRGYRATTTRDISVGAGMSPAAMYVHYESKEDLLFEICRIAHEAALNAVRFSADGAGSAPEDRLRAVIHDFTLWHAEHRTLARVAQYELDALSPEHFEIIAQLRRRTEAIVRKEIVRGVRENVFTINDVSVAVLAVVSLGIDVARWFRADARITPQSLATEYGTFAVTMLRSGNAG